MKRAYLAFLAVWVWALPALSGTTLNPGGFGPAKVTVVPGQTLVFSHVLQAGMSYSIDESITSPNNDRYIMSARTALVADGKESVFWFKTTLQKKTDSFRQHLRTFVAPAAGELIYRVTFFDSVTLQRHYPTFESYFCEIRAGTLNSSGEPFNIQEAEARKEYASLSSVPPSLELVVQIRQNP